MKMKKLLNIEELASLLNIKKSTVYAWVHYKKIPFVKLGGRVNFIEDQIIEFIKENNFVPEA